MENGDYFLSECVKSVCTRCRGHVHMLSAWEIKEAPAFYLCWTCKTVNRIGAGLVKDFVG